MGRTRFVFLQAGRMDKPEQRSRVVAQTNRAPNVPAVRQIHLDKFENSHTNSQMLV
jgi:hypothetical protein